MVAAEPVPDDDDEEDEPFVVAAVLTPPDVLSQTMLALPMCLLYELGILGARSLTRPAPAEPVSPADG